jgi:hypothetical protein
LQVNPVTKNQVDNPSTSTSEPTCHSVATTIQSADDPESIPQVPIKDKTMNINEPKCLIPRQPTTATDAMVAEPEEVDELEVAPKSLLQRRQVRDLRVSTDHQILPKSSSFSTPLQPQHRLSPYLRGSLSESTSAKSPTVIPPDFSLATKRPLRRRHSTILVTTQRLEEEAKSKEVLTSKVPSAISRRAFGFEPIFGEWEKRAQAEVNTTITKQNSKNTKL